MPATCSNLDQSEILSSVNGLTALSKMTYEKNKADNQYFSPFLCPTSKDQGILVYHCLSVTS